VPGLRPPAAPPARGPVWSARPPAPCAGSSDVRPVSVAPPPSPPVPAPSGIVSSVALPKSTTIDSASPAHVSTGAPPLPCGSLPFTRTPRPRSSSQTQRPPSRRAVNRVPSASVAALVPLHSFTWPSRMRAITRIRIAGGRLPPAPFFSRASDTGAALMATGATMTPAIASANTSPAWSASRSAASPGSLVRSLAAMAVAPAERCWLACASSWPSSRSPSGVPGRYCPGPKYTSDPIVNACASCASAAACATSPVCNRTPETSPRPARWAASMVAAAGAAPWLAPSRCRLNGSSGRSATAGPAESAGPASVRARCRPGANDWVSVRFPGATPSRGGRSQSSTSST
jgi:hypothetical protein